MPWQLSLVLTFVLFLVAPFFKKWVDISIWPAFTDWWSERSCRSVKQQIAYLEHKLDDTPVFEECLVASLKQGFIGLYLLTAEVVAFSLAIMTLPHVEHMNVSGLSAMDSVFKYHPAILIVLIFLLLGLLGVPAMLFLNAFRVLQQLRYGRADKQWREKINKRLDKLRTKLIQLESRQ